jgi:hypothetical protein
MHHAVIIALFTSSPLILANGQRWLISFMNDAAGQIYINARQPANLQEIFSAASKRV